MDEFQIFYNIVSKYFSDSHTIFFEMAAEIEKMQKFMHKSHKITFENERRSFLTERKTFEKLSSSAIASQNFLLRAERSFPFMGFESP